jgi:hypothetical protein
MQYFMAIEIPALTLDLMSVGHLSIIAMMVVETSPEPFPTHPNWCFFTGTVEQHHVIPEDVHSHNEPQIVCSIININWRFFS